MLAVISPGQGAQTAGMLRPWLELPGAADRLAWWSAAAGVDLVRMGTEADQAEITDTAVAQPLLVATGLLAAEAVLGTDTAGASGALAGQVLAGHSVGEITAAVLAGCFDSTSGLAFVRQRGLAMAAAAAREPTGMTALLGGDTDAVLARLAELDLEAANVNGAGQVVAAGSLTALEALRENPPAGARLRPLSVAGAFHTRYMRAARDELAGTAAGLRARDPRVALVSNADGALIANGPDVRDRLVAQVASPVRFDLCLATLGELGVTGVLELAPGGTLAGLVKRVLPGVPVVAVKTPADLDAARALLQSAAATPTGETGPAWRLVVAPVKGTLRRGRFSHDDALHPGDLLGQVEGRHGSLPLVADHGGTLIEWLAEDGDPVSAGQPMVRLHPSAGDPGRTGSPVARVGSPVTGAGSPVAGARSQP